ncbi:TolB family protein [Scytonema millei VB511283]|uniref:TolB family protein n=1 Tax=Scytonema millei VB511283 TaxID=1245923 RepID=A0A9X5I7N3_9CYAN|nr:TolB family protein [Scytonema millei VB511283]
MSICFSLFILLLVSCLSGCSGSPHLLSYPFDPGGRSLNSPAAELSGRVADEFVVFTSDRFGRQDVYLFNLKTSSLVNLPGLNSVDAIASDPDLSADGRYIVFTGSRRGQVGIFLYDRETRQLRNLTANLAAEVRHPTISNDGNRIAFESSANGQWDILVCDRAGNMINVPMNPQ